MDGPVPLRGWYLSVQLVSALILTTTGLLVYTRTETHHRREFVVYVAVQVCWLVVTAAKFLVAVPEAKYALSLLSDLLALGAVVSLGYFATVYTNRSRSPRRPQNAVVLAWLPVAVGGILTQPLVGLQYTSVRYHQEPTAYLATTPGPTYLLNAVMAAFVVVVSLGYLARLFSSSTHRPTSSVLLLVAAALASLSPNAVSTLNAVPVLPGYDYTAFGVVPLTVLLAYTVFVRGELDLAPMARAEIVDEIDDALFGLDDAGRIIDYNAAAAPLVPDDVDTPVGAPLSTLLPELSLPAADEDVSTTYSTVVDGRRTHYAVTATPIVERGTVAGYSVILRDVTDSETAKRELARQNEQLELFASTVAHDLRNPLQVADGAGTLLLGQLRTAEGATAADAVDHLERATDAIDRMDARLGELQTLAEHAQSVTETQSVAFGEAVRSAWAAVDTGGMALDIGRDGHVEAEQARLASVLEELLRNSREREATRVEAELTPTGFVYRDDGRRISDDDRTAVFHSDRTAATPARGLGLEIVRVQVEAQGWSVGIERTPAGTAFLVTGGETTVDGGESA